jgi:hypothetical protein
MPKTICTYVSTNRNLVLHLARPTDEQKMRHVHDMTEYWWFYLRGPGG